MPRIVDDEVYVEDFEELLHGDGAVVEFLSREGKDARVSNGDEVKIKVRSQ